jgi:hypothetical protein
MNLPAVEAIATLLKTLEAMCGETSVTTNDEPHLMDPEYAARFNGAFKTVQSADYEGPLTYEKRAARLRMLSGQTDEAVVSGDAASVEISSSDDCDTEDDDVVNNGGEDDDRFRKFSVTDFPETPLHGVASPRNRQVGSFTILAF